MSNSTFWTSSVGYDQFARDIYSYFSLNFRHLRDDYKFPDQFIADASSVARNNHDSFMFLYVALFTIGWTMLRNAFTEYFIQPLAKRFQLPPSEQDKLPECAWKFFYYICAWNLAAYILIVKEQGRPLLHPQSMWEDWHFTNPLPVEYHVLYVVQLSFYLHSIYATIVMDRWRKDSIVLVMHHVLAVLLIFFTFSARAHQAATVTFFLHDICDILLEGTKCSLYFKTQGKREFAIFEYIANVGFLMFSATWFVSRLYVFPLRLIWSCTTTTTVLNLHVPLMFMLNSMLCLLLIMNFYWFTFIVKLLYKVATGNEELEDSREYDEAKLEAKQKEKQLKADHQTTKSDKSQSKGKKEDLQPSREICVLLK